MLSLLSLSLCLSFIVWLFVRDRKLRPMTSWPLWIAFLWIIIVGTRFVSAWHKYDVDLEVDFSELLLEGSSIDRNIFLVLILAGAMVLIKRKPDWSKIFAANRWFFIFILYCAISIIWSDYPFVSFKRWIKEIGNVIMVLIIVTEKNPLQAIRALFARYSYVVIPLSLLLIYMFPEFGTQFGDQIETAYTGVTINKNTLGVITLLSTLFLVWDLIYLRNTDALKTGHLDLILRLTLLLMAFWLMFLASSMTAIVCLIVGTTILFIFKFALIRSQVRFIGTYSILFGMLIVCLASYPDFIKELVKGMGRDITFTGRTELWADLIKEPVNPLMGTGYQSFWLGRRADILWEKYYYHPIQAHNGYLETYLNGGLIGLLLLVAMIITTGNNLKRQMQLDNRLAVLLTTIFVTSIFYSMTEAMFSRLSLLWVVLSIVILYQPQLSGTMATNIVHHKAGKPVEGV